MDLLWRGSQNSTNGKKERLGPHRPHDTHSCAVIRILQMRKQAEGGQDSR